MKSQAIERTMDRILVVIGIPVKFFRLDRYRRHNHHYGYEAKFIAWER